MVGLGSPWDLAPREALVADGRVRAHVSARYPLERAADAITELAERRAEGKAQLQLAAAWMAKANVSDASQQKTSREFTPSSVQARR